MLIKSIDFAHEITDVDNDNVDVFVESENGYTYTVVVATPKDFLGKMDEEKINFVEPATPTIIVKKLTKEIVAEAIEAYAEDDAYWLKLYQFADAIDISVLDKLEAEHREEWELYDLEGLDRVFYHIQKYIKVSADNRVLLSIMLFFTVVSSIAYCVLKPGLLDFFSNILH